ncbi:MAG: urease accessory protein [Paracoccaceae bacterium]
MSCKLRDGHSVLDHLHQQGSMKLLFPRTPQNSLTGVTLNTAGGITGGDRFDVAAKVGAGCHMVLTTQAAERAYRAQPGEIGRLTNRVTVGAQARLDWLPQETLLYDHAALHRSLEIDLAPDARLLAVEPVIFGRAEMGEVVQHLDFRDRIDLRRAGQVLFADRTLMHGDAATQMRHAATGAGCGAMASVLLAADDAERFLTPARALMPATGGVSLIRDGLLFARLLAVDGFILRKTLVPLIELLGTAPMPRTWMI